ncbi:hypothetical protein BGZ76_008364 [Entomortierella beljakovae]|nr:hypothetical protein BGZ76_008364 [Entomortierella beljakovae]
MFASTRSISNNGSLIATTSRIQRTASTIAARLTVNHSAHSLKYIRPQSRFNSNSTPNSLLNRPTRSTSLLTPNTCLRRQYATSSSSPSTLSILRRIPTLAVALALSGITLTAIGLWQFYTSGVNRFPEGIRSDLRKALYYQNYGEDREKAVGYYRKALNAAMVHPELTVDGPEVTGIMIQLGTMFQDMGRTLEAIDVLVMAFECLVHGRTLGTGNDSVSVGVANPQGGQKSDLDHQSGFVSQGDEVHHHDHQHDRIGTMDGPTRLKTVGIAQKLGDLYHSIKKDQQAERYYLWSVEQMLKNHDQIQTEAKGNSEEERLIFAREKEAMKKQFDFEKLPNWMTKTDLGASLEALGGFYTSKGIYRNALPLYMRALSLSDAKSCHTAVLMCNISDTFAGMGNIDDAMGWAERGLKVGTSASGQECDEGCGVLLFNLGMLHEMKGDIMKAKEYYSQSKQHGLKTGFDRCIVESNKALKRIKESTT